MIAGHSLARMVEQGRIENVFRLQVMNATESTQRYVITVGGLPGIEHCFGVRGGGLAHRSAFCGHAGADAAGRGSHRFAPDPFRNSFHRRGAVSGVRKGRFPDPSVTAITDPQSVPLLDHSHEHPSQNPAVDQGRTPWWRIPQVVVVGPCCCLVVVAICHLAVIAVNGPDPVLNKEDYERELRAAQMPSGAGRTDALMAVQPAQQARNHAASPLVPAAK